MTAKKTTKKTKTEEVEPQVLSVDEEVQEEEEPVTQPEPEQAEPPKGNVVEVIVKEEPPASNIYVYIGPNLKVGLLRKNQIFKGGKPEIAGVTDVYPMINELFIPVADRIEAIKQVNKKGTYLNLAYENIKGV